MQENLPEARPDNVIPWRKPEKRGEPFSLEKQLLLNDVRKQLEMIDDVILPRTNKLIADLEDLLAEMAKDSLKQASTDLELMPKRKDFLLVKGQSIKPEIDQDRLENIKFFQKLNRSWEGTVVEILGICKYWQKTFNQELGLFSAAEQSDIEPLRLASKAALMMQLLEFSLNRAVDKTVLVADLKEILGHYHGREKDTPIGRKRAD